MATHIVADRPFADLDVINSDAHDEVVEPVDLVGLAEETFDEVDDRLGPARGILLALLFSIPFWVAVLWLVW